MSYMKITYLTLKDIPVGASFLAEYSHYVSELVNPRILMRCDLETGGFAFCRRDDQDKVKVLRVFENHELVLK